MSLALLAVAFVCGYYYSMTISHPKYKAMRARYREQLRERRKRIAPAPKRAQAAPVCARCHDDIRPARVTTPDESSFEIPKITLREFQTMMEESRNGEFVQVAGTGCELTDQIFAAAWKKGIRPSDVIGPEPGFEK